MSGGSKKQTVGYRYRMGLHMGLCRGPVDAVLEKRVGDRTAWSGSVNSSQQVYVDAPKLFGGDEKEGGIQGALDIEFGEATQTANDYLEAKIGAGRPAYRGILGMVFRGGLITSNNPYIKPWSVRVRRILQGWKGGSAWYPEKAEVQAIGGVLLDVESSGWEYQVIPHHANPGYDNLTPPSSGWTSGGVAPFGDWTWPGQPAPNTAWPAGTILWARRTVTIPNGSGAQIRVRAENGCVILVDGQIFGSVNRDNPQVPLGDATVFTIGSGTHTIAIKAFDESPSFGDVYLSAEFTVPAVQAMNPAHIVYECLTNDEWGMGYDASILDLDAFEAAADTFHAEGLGLCLMWSRQDSIENFIKVVLDHAGAVLVEDRRTLQVKLVPIRGDYVLEDLPHFGDAQGNVIAMQRLERAAVTDAINEVTVSYTDAGTGKTGSVTVQNLAAIQAAGRVISQSRDYPGLPSIELALRTAMRDLNAVTSGLARTRLTVNREGYDLVPGKPIRFSWSEDGISEMALRVIDIDYGSLTDGRVQLDCVEDVFGLPATVYVQPQPVGWSDTATVPQPSPAVAVFEAPFRELVQRLGRGETEALPADAGYLAAVAARPLGFALNYLLYTRTGADPYAEATTADWCPSGTLQAGIAPLTTSVVLEGAQDLDLVEVGTIGMLGDDEDAEIVRVDGVDTGTSTLTLGRGCLDTVPKAWPAGTRFFAIDEYSAGATTEYVDGETVDAKARTQTSTGLLDEAGAPGGSVTMAQRQLRPYPPGKLRITNDLATNAAYPVECVGALTVSWAHRDRLLQDDQVIDAEEASIGPEAGTTYTVRFYLDGALDSTQTGISGTSAAPYTMTGNGIGRVEVEAVRDGLASWQAAVAEFDYFVVPTTVRITDAGDNRITDSGARRILE